MLHYKPSSYSGEMPIYSTLFFGEKKCAWQLNRNISIHPAISRLQSRLANPRYPAENVKSLASQRIFRFIYIILHYITLYYIILYYVVLYHIILHYITLYYIISYYITLIHIILYIYCKRMHQIKCINNYPSRWCAPFLLSQSPTPVKFRSSSGMSLK